jgi:hypothetical protein
MSDAANRFDEKMFYTAAILIGAAFVGSPLILAGAALAVICGPIIAETVYTALLPDRSHTGTPTPRQPEPDRADPTAEPESETLCLQLVPTSGPSWRELVIESRADGSRNETFVIRDTNVEGIRRKPSR